MARERDGDVARFVPIIPVVFQLGPGALARERTGDRVIDFADESVSIRPGRFGPGEDWTTRSVGRSVKSFQLGVVIN